MKLKLLAILLGTLIITAAPASQAQIAISVGVNGCGYSYYYQGCPAYAPPIGVYFGGGAWGNDRHYRGGNRDHGGHDGHGGRR